MRPVAGASVMLVLRPCRDCLLLSPDVRLWNALLDSAAQSAGSLDGYRSWRGSVDEGALEAALEDVPAEEAVLAARWGGQEDAWEEDRGGARHSAVVDSGRTACARHHARTVENVVIVVVAVVVVVVASAERASRCTVMLSLVSWTRTTSTRMQQRHRLLTWLTEKTPVRKEQHNGAMANQAVLVPPVGVVELVAWLLG